MEEPSQERTSLFQHALKWGMFLGALNVVMAFLVYKINYEWIAETKVGILIILLVLVFTIYGGINFRYKSKSILNYWEAYQHGIIMMAIGGFIYSVYNLLLYTVIAPELPVKLMDASIAKVERGLNEIGMKAEIIKDAIEEARKSGEAKFSVRGVLVGYPVVLLFYAVCAFITAFLV